jgi:hypothetical protein
VIGAFGASKLPGHFRCAHIAHGAERSQLPRRISELSLEIETFERSRADPCSAREITDRSMDRFDEIDNGCDVIVRRRGHDRTIEPTNGRRR